jgi:hypothetical protein
MAHITIELLETRHPSAGRGKARQLTTFMSSVSFGYERKDFSLP